MSKPYKIFRTEAHQIVRWTYDSATSPTDVILLDTPGSYTCGGCGCRHRGTVVQAERHARGCRKTNAGTTEGRSR